MKAPNIKACIGDEERVLRLHLWNRIPVTEYESAKGSIPPDMGPILLPRQLAASTWMSSTRSEPCSLI